MELVSVVIPTHFRADRLEKALTSVCNQTYKNLEVIVVSDGYDKLTEDLVNEFIVRDSRIQFIAYEKSMGGNHARNIGIQKSTGRFIAFLDDDDIWYPKKIELQVELINSRKEIGLVGCAIKVVENELNCSYITHFKKAGNLSKDILYGNIIGSTSCVLLKKEVINECGYFDESLPARQDHDLWIRVCQNYDVDFVNTVLLEYNVYKSSGNEQQISKSMVKFFQAHDILMEKYQYLYENLSSKDQEKLIAARYLSIAGRAHEIGETTITRTYARKAWKVCRSNKAFFYSYFYWIPRRTLVIVKSKLSSVSGSNK